MLTSILLLALGIALLYWGGEVLVTNAIRLAVAFGVTPMVIGLTVVAFATSAPELAATLTAAFRGVPDIAIGNVLGSNVANLALILASSALFYPLVVEARFLRREVAFMIFVSVLLYPVMLTDLQVGRVEGTLFFVLLLFFIRTLLKDPDNAAPPELEDEDLSEPPPVWRSSLGVALGVGLLVGGAQALVIGASDIAISLGVPERVVGLSVVAFGTSLPELAASIAAARQKQGDLVLGNIVGSNIFNILCILGLTPIVHPIAVNPTVLVLDFWVMLGVSVLLALMLFNGRKLVRWEGAFLLAIYFGYMGYLFVQ